MEKNFYRVGKEETVISIANKFCVSPFSIIEGNFLKDEVKEGDMLVIKGPEKVYSVEPLDDFSSVANKLGVSENYLRRINPVPYLFFGLKIKIKEELY